MKKLICLFLLAGCTMFGFTSCTEDEIKPSNTEQTDPPTGAGGSGLGGKI